MLCRRDSQGTSPGRQLSLVVDLSKSDCGPADARSLVLAQPLSVTVVLGEHSV